MKRKPNGDAFFASRLDIERHPRPAAAGQKTLMSVVEMTLNLSTGEVTSIRQRSGVSHVSFKRPCLLHIRNPV